MGFGVSVLDIAPTILKIYGIDPPAAMKGRVLTEIFK
jgi:bisphosphoglycerate-independent phosphoglycerate mutase (AlkP superfamily)